MNAKDARNLAVIGRDFQDLLLDVILSGQGHLTKIVPMNDRDLWASAASAQGWLSTPAEDNSRVVFVPKDAEAWTNLRLRVCDLLSVVEKAVTNAAALGNHDTVVSLPTVDHDTPVYFALWCKRNGFALGSRSGFLTISWYQT